MLIISLITALLTLYYAPLSDAASCTTYTTQANCIANTLCAWFTTYCGCSSDTPLDIVFVLDSSGSMSSDNYATEKNFTVSMITTGIGNDSHVGVIQFSASVRTIYNFSRSQYPRNLITSAVNSTTHIASSTYMKSAISAAIGIFNSSASRSSAEKILLFMTDGVPSDGQSPCSLKTTLDALSIKVVVVGIGSGWTTSTIKCLVDNQATQIISVSSFTTTAFDAVRQYTDSFICPSYVDIALSEVRPTGNTTGRGAFIELYNNGDTIHLSANPLNFTGLVIGSITNYTLSQWTNKTYLILYSNSSGDGPNCKNCSCTDGSTSMTGLQCSTATYIKCSGITSTGGCYFPTTYKGSAVSKNNWGVQVIDKSDGSYVVNVSYSSSFPSIWDNYTYELQSLTADTTDGSNWAQSCYLEGTPGAGPLSLCVQSCTNATCRSSGDTGAYCSTPSSCTCSSDRYQLNTICYKINPPYACTTLLLNDNDATNAIISWSSNVSVTISSLISYYVQYGNLGAVSYTGTTTTTYLFTTYTDASLSDLVPIVTIKYNGTIITSANVSCPFQSSAPTPAPTLSPTYSIPTVPSCIATVVGTGANVTWSNATIDYPNTPSSVTQYKIYSSSDSGATYSSFYSASSPYFVSDAFTTYTTLRVKVSAVVYNSDGDEETSRMNSSATQCDIYTQSPTRAPTKVPTKVPTKTPTFHPTFVPTNLPTHSPRGISSCTVNVLQGGHSFTINYQNTSCVSSSDCATMTIKIRVEGKTIAYDVPYSGYTLELSSYSFTGTDNYTLVYTYPQSASSGSSTVSGEFTCTSTTVAPTNIPTPPPTNDPTIAPSASPTIWPTNAPTFSPTTQPTFENVEISSCTYNLTQKENGVISSFFVFFTEPTLDDAGVTTPIATDLRYKIVWGSSQETVQGRTSGASYTATVNQEITINDVLTITVWYLSSRSLGSSTTCQIHTLAPTPYPTTAPPTPYPTRSDPVLTINYTAMGCIGNDVSGIPECSISESNTEPFSTIIVRTPSDFPSAVTFKWDILFNEPTRRRNLQESENKTGANYYDITGNITGNGSVISGARSGEVSVTFRQESSSQNSLYDGDSAEIFYLQISNCDVPEFLDGKYYDCTIDVDTIKILVSNSNGAKTTNTILEDMPFWIWIPIAAGLLLLPLLGWWGYRQYQKRKYAQEMNALKQKELQEAEGQDDLHNFGGLGDEIQFNPLATGGAHDITTGGEYIDQQLAEQKKDFTTATVDVDNQIYRQDFGPVQPNKH